MRWTLQREGDDLKGLFEDLSLCLPGMTVNQRPPFPHLNDVVIEFILLRICDFKVVGFSCPSSSNSRINILAQNSRDLDRYIRAFDVDSSSQTKRSSQKTLGRTINPAHQAVSDITRVAWSATGFAAEIGT